LLFGLGLPHLVLKLFFLLMIAQYLTSFTSVLVGVKRPPSPPVRRYGELVKYSYSFPSRHVAIDTILCFVCWQVAQVFGWQPTILWYCMILLYLLKSIVGDVYLWYNWVEDGGAGIFVACVAFYAERLLPIIDHLSSLRGLAGVEQWLVVALFCAVMVFHPQPKEKCPCLVDTARFTGAGLGAFLGYWLQSESVPLEIPTAGVSFFGYVVRTYTGMIMMMLTEMLARFFLVTIFFRLPLVRRWDDSRFQEFWTNGYIWSRFWSHVAFAAVCFLGGQRIIPKVMF
jgi:hypothetical protein